MKGIAKHNDDQEKKEQAFLIIPGVTKQAIRSAVSWRSGLQNDLQSANYAVWHALESAWRSVQGRIATDMPQWTLGLQWASMAGLPN